MKWYTCLFTVLIFLCGLSGSRADTVADKLASDPEFKLYAVIFGVTVDSKNNVESFHVSKVIDPKSGNTTPVDIKVPKQFIEKSRAWLVSNKKLQPKIKEGMPVEYFTYVFFAPSAPDVVITDKEKPLDKQP